MPPKLSKIISVKKLAEGTTEVTVESYFFEPVWVDGEFISAEYKKQKWKFIREYWQNFMSKEFAERHNLL